MSSLDSLSVRQLAGSGVITQVGTDTPVALSLRYIGTGTVTSVTTTTATNIVMVTSDGGTDTYAFATYTTVGSLADAITNDGIFEVRILDTLRSKATASQFVTGAITSTATSGGKPVYDVLVDTSAAKYFAARLTYSREFQVDRRAHRVHLQEAKYFATLGAAAANQFKIYRVDAAGTTETLVTQLLSVSATATTFSLASGLGKISSVNGGDIVVILADGTSIADAAANYLYAAGFAE